MQQLECDVLVIGSGAAGLRAAISARQKGSEVVVLSKASPGKATSTTVSGGVFAGSSPEALPDSHLTRTLQAGRGINQPDLVHIFVEEAPQRLRELVQWGINADVRKGYLFSKGTPPMWGQEITRCLIVKNEALGNRLMGGMVVADLKVVKGCARALAYSVASGSWTIIYSKAVILATGGAGALYFRHDNPRRMVGDGYMLALEAGAALQDLEFVQFYPLGIAEPGRPPFLIPPRLADCGKLCNTKGEEIHDKYHIMERPAAEKARDRLSQALFTETQRNANQVWLDLTGISDVEWFRDPFSASTHKILGDRYGAKTKALRVAPMAHHVMGGVRIDARCCSSVAGLFAAGEVAGGLHGANRMGGNALTETQVFGKRAGDSAAEWAENNDMANIRGMTDEWKDFMQRSSGHTKQGNPFQIVEKLRRVMWADGGILRNKTGLCAAFKTIQTILEETRELSLDRNPSDVQRVLDLRVAARTAALIVEAAIQREESRGAHFREDFPNQDDVKWRGHLNVHLDSSGKKVWKFIPA